MRSIVRFRPSDPSARPLARGDLHQFFGVRRHYRIRADEARLDDLDTGARHVFAWVDDELELAPVRFEIELPRIAPFVRLAHAEIADFAARFSLAPIDSEALDQANARASKEATDRVFVDADRIEDAYRWNARRADYEEALASYFVPRVVVVEEGGEAKLAAMWPEGAPIALPSVDVILIGRTEAKKRSIAAIDRDALLPHLADAPVRRGAEAGVGLIHHLVDPAQFTAIAASAKALERSFSGLGVGWDRVLGGS